MTEKHINLFSRNNFENEWFYYFFNLNYEKRHIIGERISEFQGVTYQLIFYIILKQAISFTLKENINIIIENENDINTKEFSDEILSFGDVRFFKKEKFCKLIECQNQKLKIKPKYNCILLEGNIYIFIYNIFNIQIFGILLNILTKKKKILINYANMD